MGCCFSKHDDDRLQIIDHEVFQASGNNSIGRQPVAHEFSQRRNIRGSNSILSPTYRGRKRSSVNPYATKPQWAHRNEPNNHTSTRGPSFRLVSPISGGPPSGIYFLHESEEIFCDEETNCSFCCNTFDEYRRYPRVLPCGHILCDTCVSQGAEANGHENVKCPIDGSTHQVTRDPYHQNYTLSRRITTENGNGLENWQNQQDTRRQNATLGGRNSSSTTSRTFYPHRRQHNVSDLSTSSFRNSDRLNFASAEPSQSEKNTRLMQPSRNTIGSGRIRRLNAKTYHRRVTRTGRHGINTYPSRTLSPDISQASKPQSTEHNKLHNQISTTRSRLVATISERPPSGIYFLVESDEIFHDGETTCSICCDEFDEHRRCPRVLPCGHILCDTCVLKEAETNGHENVKCPLDRSIHQITNDPLHLNNPSTRRMRHTCRDEFENLQNVGFRGDRERERMSSSTTTLRTEQQRAQYNTPGNLTPFSRAPYRVDFANIEPLQAERPRDITTSTPAYLNRNHLPIRQPPPGIDFLEEPSEIVYGGETNCFICHFKFDESIHYPRVLPCGHIYCDACITDIAQCSNHKRVTCPIDMLKHNIL